MNYDCKIVVKAARQLKLKYKKRLGVAYGVYRDVTFVIYRDIYASSSKFYISLCASKDGKPIQPNRLQELKLPSNVFCAANGYRINMIVMSTGSKRSIVNKMTESVSAVVDYMNAYGFVNCDEKGVVGHPSVYVMDERYCFLNDESLDDESNGLLYESVNDRLQLKIATSISCREGIRVTFLCTLLCSVILFFIVHMCNFVCLSGIVIGVVSMGCYSAVDKNCSFVGIAVCCAFSLIFLYLIFRMDLALNLYKECEAYRQMIEFHKCLLHPKLILEEYGWIQALGEYNYAQNWYTTLGIYIFAVVINVASLLEEKEKEQAERMKRDRYRLD